MNFESWRDIPTDLSGGITNSLKNDVAGGIAKGVGQGLSSFFGGAAGHGGESMDRQERPHNLDRREAPQQTYEQRQKSNEILLFSGPERRKQQQYENELNAVRAELDAIIKELQSLGHAVQEAEKVVAQETPEVGVYQVNMLDKIRQMLKLFRQQIADSGAWLNVASSKKKKGYWAKYKKHGTSFGLSQERTVATQAG